jgi:hypothetical protein
VPEGEGSWLFFLKKLVTEAPVNGGRNYKNLCSYKIWLNAGISR